MEAQQVILAVHTASNPSSGSVQRKEAVALLEKAKSGDPKVICTAFVTLFQSGESEAQLNGLLLLRHVVRAKWRELQAAEKQSIAQQILAACQNAAFVASMQRPVKTQLAYVLCDVSVRLGPEFTEQTLSMLMSTTCQEAQGAYLGFKVLQYVSEEVGDNGLSSVPERKRDLLSCMTQLAPRLLQCAIQGASHFVSLGMQAHNGSRLQEAAACQAAISSCLDALKSLVSWLPLPLLHQSELVDACKFLVQTDEFKSSVLEICLQLSSRSNKQASKDQQEYAALYNDVAALLCFAVPKVCPPGASVETYSSEAERAELAMRMSECLSEFERNGHLLVVSGEVQLQVLQHLLAFVSHDYLPLAEIPLHCWRRLVQGHERSRNTHVDSEDELPPYMDAVSEWKEFCSIFKSQVKYILSSAALCEPVCALAVARELVQKAPPVVNAAPAGESSPTAAVHILEVLAFALDAIVSSVCAIPTRASCVPEMEAMLSDLLAMQPRSAACVALMGKLIESFAPVADLDSRLVQPAVDAFFSLINTMHNLRGGQPVGNDDTAQFTREQRQLSKCFFTLANKAPAACAPYLQHVEQRTSALLTSGVIGDADRNQIFEGVLVAAASQGAAAYAQAVAWLLMPHKEFWVGLTAQLESEQAFVSSMLGPVAAAVAGDMRVEKWELRANVFYTLQLLMFASRQCKGVKGGDGGRVRSSFLASQPEAMADHLQWILLPAMRLHRCLMGLAQQAVIEGPLAPIKGILELSPLERAVCVGQQAFLDAKTRADEIEPGRMDGTSLHGVRNWVRQCKEVAMMLLMECASIGDSFWQNPTLCAEIPGDLLYCLELQEPRSLRLVLHHGVIPLLRVCPPASAVPWLGESMRSIVALLTRRVGATWRDMVAKTQGKIGGAKSKQTEDEIIQEALLRELSRDAVEVLRVLVGSTSFPQIPADRLATLATTNVYALSPAHRAKIRMLTSEASEQQRHAARSTNENKAPALNSVPWDQTVASALLPAYADVVEGSVQLAAQAMSWPDLQTQIRAVAVCRTVAAAAGAPLNPAMNSPQVASQAVAQQLQPMLVRCLLPAAMFALTHATAPHAASEMILLIRSIYISCSAAQPSPVAAITHLLPKVAESHIAQLNAELDRNRQEKNQKDVFKRFFVEFGFHNLDTMTDKGAHSTSPSPLKSVRSSSGSSRADQSAEAPIQWPDLFDIHIPI